MDWSRESDDGFIPFPTDAISPVSQQDFIVREGGGIRAGDPQMMDSKHPLKNSSLYQSGRITPTARLISNPTPPNLQTDKNAKTDKLEAMKAKLMESRRLNGASVPLPKNSTKSSLTAAHPQLDSDTSAAVADIIRKANFRKNELANGNSKLSSNGNVSSSNGSNLLKGSNPHDCSHNGYQMGQHTGVEVDKNITVTVHKDIGNEGNEIYGQTPGPTQINQGKSPKVTGITQNTHESLANFRKSVARPTSPPPRIVHHSSTDMGRPEVSLSAPDSSFLKNYFSDLNEWLEVTGYHDTAHRKRRLAMFRERQQLEQQLAKVKKAEEEEDHRTEFNSGPPALSESRPSTGSIQPSHMTQRPRGNDGGDESSVNTTLPSTTQNTSAGVASAKRPYSAVADTFVSSPQPRKQVRSAQYDEDNILNIRPIESEIVLHHHDQRPPLGPQGHESRNEEHTKRPGNSSLTWVRPQPEEVSGRKPDPENNYDRSRELKTHMDSRDGPHRPLERRDV